MFIVFDMENKIFGLPRELVVTVAGKVISFIQSFEPRFLGWFILTVTLIFLFLFFLTEFWKSSLQH